MSAVLEVDRLVKHFTLHLRAGRTLSVLDGVGLSVDAGECVALVGPSGRGKSTLIKCIHGNYAVDAGTIRLRLIGGEWVDLARADPRRMLALRRRELAYVSQFLRVMPRQAALDIVADRLLDADGTGFDGDPLDDTPHLAALDAARQQVAVLFSRLALPRELWSLPPATFSGGEQQRVNIARGFIVPSRLLLLDEPTASLDAANRRIVIDLIREAKTRGSAIVGIFHDEEVRNAVADRHVQFAPA